MFTRLLCSLLVLLGLGLGVARAQPLEDWERMRPHPATGFRLYDLDGQIHTLGAYRGKVIIVNFWASWCPPCVDEMPSLQALRKSLDPERAVVLTINSEDSAAKARAFLRKHRLDLPVLLDPDDRTGTAWRVDAYPTSYIVDTRGRWRYSIEGEVDFMADETRRLVARLIQESDDAPRAPR